MSGVPRTLEGPNRRLEAWPVLNLLPISGMTWSRAGKPFEKLRTDLALCYHLRYA